MKSSALRYLACNVQTAPLHSRGGIALETIVYHHLQRFSTAIYIFWVEGNPSNNYLCSGYYELVQAWSPAATRGDATLNEETVVMDEVNKRYGFENIQESHDIPEIALLIEYDEFDLVVRQSVSNAQGADVMVLTKRRDKHFSLIFSYIRNRMGTPVIYN